MTGSFDVFGTVREKAMRTGNECKCVAVAHRAATSMNRSDWSSYLVSLDWFLTYYGRQVGLVD